jgi:multidrug resistance efflux pump
MVAALLITAVFIIVFWLVFFQFKLIKLTIPWAVVSSLFLVHLLLAFLIGIRFVAPYSEDAKIIQYTIQLVPRLPEPTLVTAVLVEPDAPVKKGQPLIQFDRRPYEDKVKQLEAQLAQARQNVPVLKADMEAAQQKVIKAQSELEYAKYQKQLYGTLASKGAGPEEDFQKWSAQIKADEAGVKEAQAEVERARLKYTSQIGGVNTTVAEIQGELDLARFYLNNTTLVAPEDGHIINLQVRPGMVVGDIRFGAIASFICDNDRYLLATYYQENLKYVKLGQPVEVAMNLFPGQIFKGKVNAIWRGSGEGQMLPSGTLPNFQAPPPTVPRGRYAVRIALDEDDMSRFTIGAQGAAAVYTSDGGFAGLRRIVIRLYSWVNWLYPLPEG